jgi:type I restriction enzyme M protein
VRFPNGVFTPYTPIPTNVLFFDASGSTESVWFYQVTPADDRKHFTKTKPLTASDLAEVLSWWPKRKANASAWNLSFENLAKGGFNLDQQHPSRLIEIESEPPAAIMERILSKEQTIHGLMRKLETEIQRRQ